MRDNTAKDGNDPTATLKQQKQRFSSLYIQFMHKPSKPPGTLEVLACSRHVIREEPSPLVSVSGVGTGSGGG